MRIQSVFIRVLLGISFVSLSGPAVSDEESDLAADCSIRASGGEVAVIVCPPGSHAKVWRAAGRKACAASRGICNAWIWEDADKAPLEAPLTDSDLPEAQVKAAVAVWINDSERMMLLRKVDPV